MEIIPGQCKKTAKNVSNEDIAQAAKEMWRLCHEEAGKYGSALAIAHPQVDHENPLRFFVTAGGEVIANPIILEKSEPFTHTEGCMSFPFRGKKKVKRYKRIKVEYMQNGQLKTEEITDLKACIFQHEIDHMNGKSIYS